MQKLLLFVFRGRHVPHVRNRRGADLVIIKFVRNTPRRIHEVNCAAPITQSALLVTREEFARFGTLDALNRQIIVGVDVQDDPYQRRAGASSITLSACGRIEYHADEVSISRNRQVSYHFRKAKISRRRSRHIS